MRIFSNSSWGRLWTCLAAFLVAAPLIAQPPDPELTELIRSTYTKYDYRIPMRDGVRLFTTVYVPNEISDQTYPLLIHRTPYSAGPYGADEYRESIGPAPEFVREGFIFVYQDVRGRWMSEGEYVNMRPMAPRPLPPGAIDEATDTWDTIDWLVGHVPRNNGKAGLWGISYPGFYSSAGAIDSHPALKAVSPQAPIADWFWDDMHRHGAFVLPLAFNFFSRFGQARPEPTDKPVQRFEHGTADGYQFFLDLGPLSNVNERYFKGEIGFWNDIVAHPNYDEFWQSRNVLPHLKGVKAAVLTVGGWFDTEDLYGPLQTYRHFEDQNPGITNTLVMGPWPHGGWARTDGHSLGEADFGFATSKYFTEEVELPFFVHYLKDGKKPALPEALVFETGPNRWRELDAWPPKGVRQEAFYMQADHGLAATAPVTQTPSDEEPSDAYVSDPSKPVPYTTEITTRWAREYMTEDQRFAARRPDVLVYETPALDDDLTFAGPIEADLWVSTTGTDSDFIVKVIDVFPTDEPSWKDDDGRDRGGEEEKDLRGTQRLVRAAPIRGRFRNSYEVPEPFVPGQPTRVTFRLNDVFHTFQRGHRLMVQIQSTWFPFIDRNPQTFVPNIFEAQESDFVTVTNRVYRSPEHPSRIRAEVLEQASP